jgi:peptide/nickel transport system permease protein
MSALGAAFAVVAPNRAAAWAFAALLAICLVCVAAPLVAPYGPADQDLMQRLEAPSALHWFGTDNYGRDILSRILWGARISLLIGLGATLSGMAVGGALGVWAGFKGGVVDLAIARIVDVLLSFPSLILCLLIVSLVGPGVVELIAAIAVSLIPKFARVARSSAIATSHKEFVDACRTVGGSDLRIMLRHIAPNVVGELAVMASLWTANAVLIESSLSFLGLGVRPPTPTLGGMMMEGLNLLHDAPWLTLFPGLVILGMVLVLNLVGDNLRDAVDPRLRAV